jgi:regulator of sigma E protease
MTILLFLLIIGVLIFVHELGHFVVAKWFGIRVDEFGMGLPPRAVKLFSRKGTDYTLNWIPFGGFVKIYGEDALSETPESDPDYQKSFGAKKWWQQIAVLIAGVTMNFILAWVLFSISFMSGAPTVASGVNNASIREVAFTVLQVVKDSPADQIGLKAGERIKEIQVADSIITEPEITTEKFIATIRSTPDGARVRMVVNGSDRTDREVFITPTRSSADAYPMIGVSVDQVGLYREGFFKSIGSGLRQTVFVTVRTAQAFGNLIADAVRGRADMDNLTGPVGLVSVVGDAQKVGMTYVLMLAATISVNLAVLNLFPFPALDGGRIVMVLIETVTRRKIKPTIVQWVNGIGFLLLILLMIIITVKDVIRLF